MVRLVSHAVAIVAVLLSFATQTAWAGFDDGVAAFDRGDFATALREFRTLADQGNAEAQFNVAIIYDYGHGVGSDYARAMKWYRKAAEQGFDAAQFNLGIMYDYGQGVAEEDYAEAVKWYRKAAKQGNAKAQNSLGFMYYKGRGVPRNDKIAHMWYNLAAAQGDNQAANNRDIVAEKMTPAQVTEAQLLARDWMAKFKRKSRRLRHVYSPPDKLKRYK